MTGLKGCSNIWVHIYEEALFILDLLVSLSDPFSYPLIKVSAHQRVDHVDNELSRELGHLLWWRKIVFNLFKLISIAQKIFNGQPFKVRDGEMLSMVAFDILPLS